MTTSPHGAGKSSPSESQHYDLWINDLAYIRVDNTGRCVSYCAEGSLGFIVQLLPRNRGRGWALKIPRLMGETHRENAYISDLMDKELDAVFNVQGEGLLRAEAWGIGGPLRGPLYLGQAPATAQKWDGSIVLISFEKGQNPRFCLVKLGAGGEMEFFPPGIDDCPIKTVDLLDKVRECAIKGSENLWVSTVFIESKAESGGNEKNDNAPDTSAQSGAQNTTDIFDKDQALQLSPMGKTWYTSVPSVAYEWAPGTLQEAISLGKRGTWNINQHISLMSRLCKGLSILHGDEKLHADMRPANIAYTGDPRNPNNYVLSDYGSFAETGARAAAGRPTGETVLGPVVGTERVSPFYAPERRAGREREAADIAILLDSGGGEKINIVLGWRSKLLDQETSTTPIDLKSVLEKFDNVSSEHSTPNGSTGRRRALPQKETELGPSTANLLTEGDRIQIRDYIFEVEKAADIEDMQILRCSKRSWKIYHGRIVVSHDDDVFPPQMYFPITRTVELLQWSAASDLYSLGALSLYSVYRDDFVSRDEKHQLKESNLLIEESFREMLRYLENEEYFNSLWPELEWFREELEKKLHEFKDKSREQFSKAPFDREDSSKPADDRQTLKGEAVALVRRITQTVPGTRRLVEAFNYRLGPFILFIHFVLCCLHRQSELNEPGRWKEKPFCADRLEKPQKDGSASRAWKRLEEIRELLLKRESHLAELDTDGNDIPPFEPRPEPTIRVAMYNLTQWYEQTVSLFDEKIASLCGELDSVKSTHADSLNLLHRGIAQTQTSHNESVMSLSRGVDSAKRSHAESANSLKGGLDTVKKANVFNRGEAIESMTTHLNHNEKTVGTAIGDVHTLLNRDGEIVREAIESMNTLLDQNEKAVRTAIGNVDTVINEAKEIVSEANEFVNTLLNRPKKIGTGPVLGTGHNEQD